MLECACLTCSQGAPFLLLDRYHARLIIQTRSQPRIGRRRLIDFAEGVDLSRLNNMWLDKPRQGHVDRTPHLGSDQQENGDAVADAEVAID
jgi:hypothetical protein